MDLDWLLKTFASQGPLVLALLIVVWFQNKQAKDYVLQLQVERQTLDRVKDAAHEWAVNRLEGQIAEREEENEKLQAKYDRLDAIINKHNPA